MWILIDNYDSFTHILHHYLLQVEPSVLVYRNNAITLENLIALNPQRIILSPGPGRPEDADGLMEIIDYFYDKIPLLGVCLGHQALGLYFGAKLIRASQPMHGKTSTLHVINPNPIFENLPKEIAVMRYHSLVLDELPVCLSALAFSADTNELMALSHQSLPLLGVQFHPESVLTPQGLEMIKNWAKMYG